MDIFLYFALEPQFLLSIAQLSLPYRFACHQTIWAAFLLLIHVPYYILRRILKS